SRKIVAPEAVCFSHPITVDRASSGGLQSEPELYIRCVFGGIRFKTCDPPILKSRFCYLFTVAKTWSFKN
ncbi:hypothetical protein AVEN_103754-1, partial [Araneus ventricosus]